MQTVSETPPSVALSGGPLTVADVVSVARSGARVELADTARDRIRAGADTVQRLAALDEPVYGISTGFGSLARTWIPREKREDLQRSLVRSHAAGMGPPVEREVVRALMLLRARSLSTGHTGAREEVVEAILAFLNADVTPVVFEHGSLGASGDLAPLSHCALALIGEGEVWLDGERVPTVEAGIPPITLAAKEGLALINGTDGMLGMLALAITDLHDLLALADVAAAMSVEALLGTDQAFTPELIALRPQRGQQVSAANLMRLLAGSAITASHRTGDPRVQDAYSLRCSPQVHGAARDALSHAEGVAELELASAIDNPVVLWRTGSRRAATSTARRSASPPTSSRSRPPRSARSPSAAPTACSTRAAPRACRPSSPTTPASTPA